MRDIAIWRALTAEPEPPVDIILGALRELAVGSKEERLPLAGSAFRFLEHRDPAVRCGALDVLAGAQGSFAIRRIAERLRDEDPRVREKATRAFSQSIAETPLLWIVTLFSSDPMVRDTAKECPPSTETEWLLAYWAEANDTAYHARMRAAKPPPWALPLYLQNHAEGRLPEALVLDAFEADPLDWKLLEMEPNSAGLGVDDREVEAFLGNQASSAVALAEGSRFSLELENFVLLAGLCMKSGTGASALRARLIHGAISHTKEKARRFVLGALAAMWQRDEFPTDLLMAVVCIAPDCLGWKWIPAESRRMALSLVTESGAKSWLGPGDVSRLLGIHELTRPVSGELDLQVIAHILGLAGAGKWSLRPAAKHFGRDLVDAIIRSPRSARALFRVFDRDGRHGSISLLAQIGKKAPAVRIEIQAWMLLFGDSEAIAASSRGEKELRAIVRVWQSATELPAELSSVTEARWTEIARSLMRAFGAGEVAGQLAEGLVKMNGTSPCLNGLWGGFSRVAHPDVFAEAVAALASAELSAVVNAIGDPPAETGSIGLGLKPLLVGVIAGLLSDSHSDSAIREWAREWLEATRPRRGGVPLAPSYSPGALLIRIATCSDRELGDLLFMEYLPVPGAGLCHALGRRRSEPFPCVAVGIALLCTPDPPQEIDETFAKWCPEQKSFLEELERKVAHSGHVWSLNYFGCAWRHLFEQSCSRWGGMIEASGENMAAHLRGALGRKSGVLRDQVWQAAEHLLQIWRAREVDKFRRHCDAELIDVGVVALPGELTEEAAAILKLVHRWGPPDLLNAVRDRVEGLLPQLPARAQQLLFEWLQIRFTVAEAPTAKARSVPQPTIAAEGVDLSQLEVLCWSERPEQVADAARELWRIGPEGESVLAHLILGGEYPAHIAVIVESSRNWDQTGTARGRVRDAAMSGVMRPYSGSLIAFALVAGGDKPLFPALLRYLDAEEGPHWFQREHWNELRRAGFDEPTLELGLVRSSHPGAYAPAVMGIMRRPRSEVVFEDQAAVRGFLEVGTTRSAELRRRAACWLIQYDVASALPVLLGGMEESDWKLPANGVHKVRAGQLIPVVYSVLAAAPRHEVDTATMLVRGSGKAGAIGTVLGAWFEESDDTAVYAIIKSKLGNKLRDVELCQRLAETFAWGVKVGRELTGYEFRIHMTEGERLGYTRLGSRDIWVSPLPLLRGERNGEEIVRGLILHELGHHIFHAGPESARVWKSANEEDICGGLNLVSDEHLERNLRAFRPGFGDTLKVLTAYAFLRAQASVDPEEVLQALGKRAVATLAEVPLQVARTGGKVKVESGRLLKSMAKREDSLARFLRVLRAGLGERTGDPKVARALGCFQGQFRKNRMSQLLEVARRLREIFGETVNDKRPFLVKLGAVREIGRDEDGEVARRTGGLADSELQAAINALLSTGIKTPGKGGLEMNRGEETQFQRIEEVQILPSDPDGFSAVAADVEGESRRLRKFFETLGRRYALVGPRTRGRRVVQARLARLAHQRDPRVLVAAESVCATDIFLGLIVDCSGSMAHQDHIDLARRFGVLVASAVRGNRGVDTHFWGFTDSQIFDCGDAGHCALTRLESGGGNNDAAALWHAAQVAARSRRRTKLLVMISDGLPTECTVGALRALVARLQQRRFCCAQVAVHPIEEVCFPHYVEITSEDFAAATRDFGRVITRLVGHAISL